MGLWYGVGWVHDQAIGMSLPAKGTGFTSVVTACVMLQRLVTLHCVARRMHVLPRLDPGDVQIDIVSSFALILTRAVTAEFQELPSSLRVLRWYRSWRSMCGCGSCVGIVCAGSQAPRAEGEAALSGVGGLVNVVASQKSRPEVGGPGERALGREDLQCCCSSTRSKEGGASKATAAMVEGWRCEQR